MHSSQGHMYQHGCRVHNWSQKRESKRADLKGFENTDTTCGLFALPILVSLASESRMVTVSGTLGLMGILLMIIL